MKLEASNKVYTRQRVRRPSWVEVVDSALGSQVNRIKLEHSLQIRGHQLAQEVERVEMAPHAKGLIAHFSIHQDGKVAEVRDRNHKVKCASLLSIALERTADFSIHLGGKEEAKHNKCNRITSQLCRRSVEINYNSNR